MYSWESEVIAALNGAADAIVERGKGSGGTNAFMNGIAAAEKVVRSLVPCTEALIFNGSRLQCEVLGPHEEHSCSKGIATVTWQRQADVEGSPNEAASS